MFRRVTAAQFLPQTRSLAALRRAANVCQGCELYQRGTQVVFGEGPKSATMMLVGEIPGDQEDREGVPFVGPAGWLLDFALEKVGLDRRKIYVTNVVKHFRWEADGRRRLHKKPGARHITACRPWLDAELEIIKPLVVVCLGSTAAQTFLGKGFRVSVQRGKVIAAPPYPPVVATYHPSAILRAPHTNDRDRMQREFIRDLKTAKQLAERTPHRKAV